MSKQDFAFGKKNFILITIAVVVIIIGFVLMSGGGSPDDIAFHSEIFSTRRIVVAPVVCMIGFGLMVVGILTNSKEKEEAE